MRTTARPPKALTTKRGGEQGHAVLVRPHSAKHKGSALARPGTLIGLVGWECLAQRCRPYLAGRIMPPWFALQTRQRREPRGGPLDTDCLWTHVRLSHGWLRLLGQLDNRERVVVLHRPCLLLGNLLSSLVSTRTTLVVSVPSHTCAG